ncbi:Cytochrome P450, E-class, group I [Parasponia andersonii]|uniref:Cytochrome P450, E-class, group I n=1 Tax=Parasponia andersonii TaxID=3476 RepID=A0A2P5B860_PARAD|nr:Cytochrome P450, E-class, group I [Parasponia andersonii]
MLKMSLTILLAILFIISVPYILIIIPFTKTRSKNGGKHPPGPLPLPIIGNLHMLTTLPHRGLQKLAQKYGPIMCLRLGQVLTVVVSSPEAAELFLKRHDAVFASRPRIQASDYVSYGSKGMAFCEYGPYWRNVKKLSTSQLTSPSKIEFFAGLRRDEVVSLVDELKRVAAAHEVVDISGKVGELIETITYKMILGRNNDDKYDLKGIIEESLSLMGAFNLADYVPWLGPLDLQGLTRRLKTVSKGIDHLMENILVEHEQKGEHDSTQDFVDVLLSLKNQHDTNPQSDDSYQVLTIERDNIKAILLDMLVGAFDTASATISWAFSELLRNARVMKNVQAELESVVGTEKMVEEKDLGKLQYLDMVIKETFRLHPVGPLLAPRESREDIIIEGHYIPKKTRILVNVWAIGRDPNVWSKNVEEFYPERFIGKDIDVRGHDFKFLPFGAGRRACPGMQLGLVTVRYVLAQLLHCFIWELPSGMEDKDIDMTESFGLVVGRANSNLLVKPTYRLLD